MNKRVLSRSMFNRTARNKLYNKGGLPSVQKFQFGGMPRNLPRPGGGIELRYPFISDMIRKGDVAGLTNILTTAQKNPMTSTMYGGTPVQRPNPLIDIAQGGIESIKKRPEPKQKVSLTPAEELQKLVDAEKASPVLQDLNLGILGKSTEENPNPEEMGSEKQILKTGDELKAVESKKEFNQKKDKITNQINELKNSTVDTDLSFLEQKVSPVVDSGQQNITTDEEKAYAGSTIAETLKEIGGKYKQSVDNINAGDGDPTNKVNKIDNLFANKVLTAYGITESEEEAEEKPLKDKVKEYTALVREVLGDDAATEKTLGGLNLAMFGFAMAAGESPNALTNIGRAGMKFADKAADTAKARRKREETIKLTGLSKALESEEAEKAFERSLKKIAFGEEFKFAYQVYDNKQKAERLATQLAASRDNLLTKIASSEKIAADGIASREKINEINNNLTKLISDNRIKASTLMNDANILSKKEIAALNAEISKLGIESKFTLQDDAQAFQSKLNDINNELKIQINNANNEAAFIRTVHGNFDSTAQSLFSSRSALDLQGDEIFTAKIFNGKIVKPGDENYGKGLDFLDQLQVMAAQAGGSSKFLKESNVNRFVTDVRGNPEIDKILERDFDYLADNPDKIPKKDGEPMFEISSSDTFSQFHPAYNYIFESFVRKSGFKDYEVPK